MSMDPSPHSGALNLVDERTQQEPIRVLIAAEQEVVRRGYQNMVSDHADVVVVAEASSGEEALKEIANVVPRVVIITSDLPPAGGMELTREITSTFDTSVIMTGGRNHDADLCQAVRMGVSAFLPLAFTREELLSAIHAVASGQAFLSPESTRRVFRNFVLLPTMPTHVVPEELTCLSNREVEVVRAIGLGGTNREIARQLSLSEATVKSHVTSALKKLPARDRLHIARISWQLGLVPLATG